MNPESAYDATQSPLRTPCPLHPANGSIATCERCGTFMCAQCVGPEGATLCPTCAEQTFAFPLTRSEWSVSALFNLCMEAFKPQWIMLSVAFIVFTIAYYGVVMVAAVLGGLIGVGLGETSPLLTMSIFLALLGGAALFSALLTLGFNRTCLDVLQGKPVSMGTLFSQMGSFHLVFKLGCLLALVYAAFSFTMFGLNAAAGETAATVAVVLFLPVLLVVAVFTMLMMMGFVVHPTMGFIDHLKRTPRLLGGGEIFGALGLLFISGVVVSLGGLLCGIGMIPATGLSTMLMAGLYLSLENDPAFDTSRTTGLDTIR